MRTITDELFDRCYEIAVAGDESVAVNRMMHETLVVACAEATKTMGQGFGNVFSQVDFLCKRHGISQENRVAIQNMRRHSNKSEPMNRADRLYDVRALCLFISAVFSTSIPDRLVRIIPTENKPYDNDRQIDVRYIRCVVDSWDERYVAVNCDQEVGRTAYNVDISGELAYLARIIRRDMQLNLIDCHLEGDVVTPQMVVVEPDFLIDISAIAACFTDYGHHPLIYTASRMKPRPNSQAILIGNFAGSALDDIINAAAGEYDIDKTISETIRQQALQFCTCGDYKKDDFVVEAARQVGNLKEVVDVLFAEYDRSKAVLEPSFVCEQLGIQGRVDLMTTDGRLLVEQKSGKNYNIERNRRNRYHSFQKEDHYVQLLLYYGILRYNFKRSDNAVDIRLLYSRYPAQSGLLVVNFYRQLFREAIKLRNQIVATEYHIAKSGFATILPHINARTIFDSELTDSFFGRYILPEYERITRQLTTMDPLKHAYFCRMMTFVYREQLISKVGRQEGQGGSIADLWNMPLHEKKDTGNIFTGLKIEEKRRSSGEGGNGYDEIVLRVPSQGDDFLPNFRRGDMVFLYSYNPRWTPDVRRSLLYKGVLKEITPTHLVVNLNDGQQNPDIFDTYSDTFAVEHASSDTSSSSDIRGLYEFISAPERRRHLLLGTAEPLCDRQLQLTRSYHPTYDDIVLKAKQARDYFLLVGPPGTGKTSMALRFMVEEELTADNASLLLMSYTNRAVDEICGMLTDAHLSFVRIGNANTCDPRYHASLLDRSLGDTADVEAIRTRLQSTRIVVSTTSTLQSRPFIFDIKSFTLAIVDESSQILEPSIVGILAAHGRAGIYGDEEQKCNIAKFIMIGDHKQLPAVVQQSESDSAVDDPQLQSIGLTNCRNSLFERLICHEQRNGRSDFTGILRRQGRMHPDVADFPNRMFYRKERLEPVPCQHQIETTLGYSPLTDALDHVLASHRVIFFPSPFCKNIDLSDKVNAAEARIVAEVLTRIRRYYADHFDPDATVGVIVPYRNQIAMIRRELSDIDPLLARVSIDTVERYQGSQRDVIIYSFTVQNYYQLDFLTANCFVDDGAIIDRKLNVALTRARKQMIMTGNPAILRSNPIFRQLIDSSFVADSDYSS